jgi:hypothetical protein
MQDSFPPAISTNTDEDGNPMGNPMGNIHCISVKHNSGEHAKADMIGVQALFTIEYYNKQYPSA